MTKKKNQHFLLFLCALCSSFLVITEFWMESLLVLNYYIKKALGYAVEERHPV